LLPALTAVFAIVSYDKVWLNAAFFFLTVFIYGELYRTMSLNAPRVRLGRTRPLTRKSFS
jgi:hypothetical protein